MKKFLTTALLSGVAMLVASLFVSRLLNYLFPALASEYQNPNLFRPWTDPLMSLFFLSPFIAGFVLTFVWSHTRQLFPGHLKPLRFAFLYWLLTSLPGMFITYTSFTCSLLMVASWSLTGLLQTLVGSFFIAKRYQ